MTSNNAALIEKIAAKLEAAEARLGQAQKALAEAAARETSAKRLAAILADIAVAEGELEAWALAEAVAANAERYGEDARQAVGEALLDALTRGADDGWSGRTNDIARSKFDGLREEIRTINRTILR